MKIDAEVINSQVDPTSALYRAVRVKDSSLDGNTVIGDFSRVDYCKLARKVRIDRCNHLFHATLGRSSYTGMNTVIMHADIGAFCSISWNVSIGGANHDFNRVAQHSFLYNPYDKLRPADTAIPYDRFEQPVVIGNDVWIAAGAMVARGVTVGDGAVIGANAVVTRDVAPYTVVAGSPARPIKPRFTPDVVETLLELQWWNRSDEWISMNFDVLSTTPDIKKLRALL